MKTIAALGLFLLLSASAFGRDLPDSGSRWSVSTSLTFPIVNIYVAHFNYRLDEQHEFIIGPCFQNFKHSSFEVNAYTIVLGYRYYLWRGLNAEIELYPAFNNIYSSVTGSYYPGFEVWSEFKIGYKFHLFGDRIYLIPSPGIGFGIHQSNPPPNFFDEIESPLFVPQLILGVNF